MCNRARLRGRVPRWGRLAAAATVASFLPGGGLAQGFLASKKVTVVGLAEVQNDDLTAARELALRRAQRSALEEAIGVVVKSEFSAEQREVVKDGESKFSATIEEKILTQTAGFIERHKVLKEKRDGNNLQLIVDVWVKQKSLAAELSELQSLLADAGYPKIVLLLAERYTNRAGEAKWFEKPSAHAHIEKALLDKGIEMMAQEDADAMRGDAAAFAELLANDAQVAASANSFGAEVAIVGLSDVKYSAFNELGQKMYYLNAVVTLRAVHGSTGKVLASVEAEGRGAGVNENQARIVAVEKSAPKLAQQLLDGLVTAWRTERDRGKRYVVVVSKVRKYKKHGKPLIEALAGLEGVEQVKELDFGHKRLEVEVIYKGTKDALLGQILDSVGSQKKFKRLDKVGGSGNTIELTL